MTYRAPVADIAFTLKHGAGLVAHAGARRRTHRRRCRRRAGGSRPVRHRRARAAQQRRRQVRHAVQGRRRSPCRPAGRRPIAAGSAAGWNAVSLPAQWGGQALPHALNAACIEMWNSASMAFGIGPVLTMGAAEALANYGTDELKQHLSAEARVRRMDGHDAAHRAAGRLRRRRAAHQGRARGRRQLSHHRAEDLHHLRRARSHRQHHPLRAGAAARCAGRQQGHLAVPGAEVPGQRGRLARRAQRRARAFDRAQARHSRLADLHHGLRR